jgi:hypothetical protein
MRRPAARRETGYETAWTLRCRQEKTPDSLFFSSTDNGHYSPDRGLVLQFNIAEPVHARHCMGCPCLVRILPS